MPVTSDDIVVSAIARLDSKLDSMKDDLSDARSDLSDKLSELSSISVKQQAILDEHIRRTEINEEQLKLVSGRIAPIEKHVAHWAGAGKALAVIASILSIATAAVTIYKWAVGALGH